MALQTALIGAGGIGRHLGRQARQVEEIELVSVYDPIYDSASELAYELGTTFQMNLPAIWDDPTIEAVILATPPHTHHELCQQAFAHGKHVFCEKPMALSLEDCDAMLASAKQHGRVLMVGQVLRLFPLFHQCKRWVEEGLVGELVGVNIRRFENAARLFSIGWRADPKQSGGALLEINVHEWDYLRWLGGDYRIVSAQGRQPLPEPAFIQHWHAQIEFTSGAIGQIEASIIDPLGEYSVRVQGTEGVIAFRGFGDTITCRTRNAEEQTLTAEQINLPDPYWNELRAFARAVLYNEPLPFDGHDGREAVAKALECLAVMGASW